MLRLGRRQALSRSDPVFRRRQVFQQVLAALQWLYLLGLVLIWLLLWFTTDRWWFSTMMAFGPRWIYPLPLAVLVPACLLLDRRALAGIVG